MNFKEQLQKLFAEQDVLNILVPPDVNMLKYSDDFETAQMSREKMKSQTIAIRTKNFITLAVYGKPTEKFAKLLKDETGDTVPFVAIRCGMRLGNGEPQFLVDTGSVYGIYENYQTIATVINFVDTPEYLATIPEFSNFVNLAPFVVLKEEPLT